MMDADALAELERSAVAEPMCPRCGYDQRGVVDSWTATCPMEGVCSECGLGFAWRQLLNPELSIPPWSFEHTIRRHLRAMLRTSACCFRPGRLYAAITMFAPIHAARLAIMVLAAALCGHVVIALTAAVTAWARFTTWGPLTYGPFSTPGRPWGDVANAALWPYPTTYLIGRLIFHPIMSIPILWALFTPIPFIVLVKTFNTAKVRRTHLLRGLCYSFVPMMLLLVLAIVVYASLGSFWRRWSIGFWTMTDYLTLWYTVPAAALLARHWWVFVHWYLRLPHGAAIVALMLTASLLGAVAVGMAVTPGLTEAIGWLLIP